MRINLSLKSENKAFTLSKIDIRMAPKDTFGGS